MKKVVAGLLALGASVAVVARVEGSEGISARGHVEDTQPAEDTQPGQESPRGRLPGQTGVSCLQVTSLDPEDYTNPPCYAMVRGVITSQRVDAETGEAIDVPREDDPFAETIEGLIEARSSFPEGTEGAEEAPR